MSLSIQIEDLKLGCDGKHWEEPNVDRGMEQWQRQIKFAPEPAENGRHLEASERD